MYGHGLVHLGAPARAGMAPNEAAASRRRLRCPRPRGDGPSTAASSSIGRPVPPPARGWPRAPIVVNIFAGGAPARAGMARRPTSTLMRSPGCPRPRGDGPRLTARAQNSMTVPPPARGWPRPRYPRGWCSRGAPARAGMAPKVGRKPLGPTRCPRPRGDGPYSPSGDYLGTLVPPPARGWPHLARQALGPQGGAPARAGMAHDSNSRSHGFPWCPRPRGDGPMKASMRRQDVPVPPPARGWPPSTTWNRLPTRGAPARAGMAPQSRP